MLGSGNGGLVWRFKAMGSPCEVWIDDADTELATRLGQIAQAEAERIEAKYSRYRPESLLSRINLSDGAPVTVDPETAGLLDYAAQCHRLSGGLFDITSGVLRRIWRFNGLDPAPSAAQVRALLPLIGWDKVDWRSPRIALPRGMEIDFGGLGKEYAVDCALLKIRQQSKVPVLVNFGGDLRVSGPRTGGLRWAVGVEAGDDGAGSGAVIEIAEGALTTSGDTRRFLIRNGVRYGHILNPRTGWPVKDPPRTVTVAAATCMEAGLLSTLAMLQGRGAEAFLKREGLKAWWVR